MGKLLHPGADPAKLYEQFRQANEERESDQEDTHLAARQALIGDLTGDDSTIAEYRRARNAERFLVVEPDLPLDEMTYRDYRASRLAQQRGETPATFASYKGKEKK